MIAFSHSSFQFHKGTIKTIHQTKSLLISLLFQFHKGTIKTDVPIPVAELVNISIP